MIYSDEGKAKFFADIMEDEDIDHEENVDKTVRRHWRMKRNMEPFRPATSKEVIHRLKK